MTRALRRYSQIGWRYLSRQRRRTVLTVLAVVMSVALITAAGILGQSIRALGETNIRDRFGDFYAIIGSASEEAVHAVSHHALVDEWGTSVFVGVVRLTEDLVAGVHAPDAAWARSMRITATAGRLPERPGEVAVERWFFDAARKPVSIGEAVTLEVQSAADNAAETRQDRRLRTASFTVVGFLEPRAASMNQGVSSIVVHEHDAAALYEGPLRYRLGFTTRPELPAQEAIQGVLDSVGVAPDQVHQNTALLATFGQSASNQADRAIRTVESVVAAVILIAAVAVIYNAFAISVMERIRQFGVIRTVGATPRQIRRLVFREATVVSLIGAPLGLGVGILAVWIIVLVFNATSGGVGFSGLGMTYPTAVLVGGPLLGIAAVFASALLPARRAGSVSPLEAVLVEGRFVNDRIRKRRPGVLSRAFGVSARMATQNVRRNPGRLLITVFSIGIGIALFITFAGFLQTMQYAAATLDADPLRRDISVQVRSDAPSGVSDPERRAIEALPGVVRTLATAEAVGYVAIPENLAEDVPVELVPENAEEIQERLKDHGVVVEVALIGLDAAAHEALRPHVPEGYRSLDDLAKMRGVYVPKGLHEIGETLRIAVDERIVELTVAGYAEKLPLASRSDSPLALPVAEATLRTIAGDPTYRSLSVEVANAARPEDVWRGVQALLNDRDDVRIYNLAESRSAQRAIQLQISVLLYGLVTVVTLIGGLNIVNTITTSLILRVREFGTLRAVGMSAAQMRGMVRIEAALYGLYALIAGGAVGTGLSWLIGWSAKQAQDIPWQFPWLSLAIAAVGAVALSLASAALPMRRIAGMNIVESIRTSE